MTIVPPAGAFPPSRQAAHDPAPAKASLTGGFAEVLDDRRALTDPYVGNAGEGDGAPMAVSFERGKLFGKALSFSHDGTPVSSPAPTAPGGDASHAAAPRPTFVPGHAAVVEDAASGISKDRLAAFVSNQTGKNGSAAPQKLAHPALPDHPSVSVTELPAARPAEGLAKTTPSIRNPVDGTARREGQSRTAPGSAERQQAISQLLPVNVVVRATPGGVEVAARIGGHSAVDDPELENVIRHVAESEGETLDGLIVEGRKIEGNRQCK